MTVGEDVACGAAGEGAVFKTVDVKGTGIADGIGALVTGMDSTFIERGYQAGGQNDGEDKLINFHVRRGILDRDRNMGVVNKRFMRTDLGGRREGNTHVSKVPALAGNCNEISNIAFA